MHYSVKDISNGKVDLQTLQKAETLYLYGKNQETQLPDWLNSCKALTKLSISFIYLEQLTGDCLQLPQLKSLEINAMSLKGTLSLNMPELEQLKLNCRELSAMDFSRIKNLRDIHILYHKMDIMQLLLEFSALPLLESYKFEQALSLKYAYGKANPHAYYFDKFLKTVCKRKAELREAEITDEAIQLLSDLHLKNKEQLSKAKLSSYISLLNAKYKNFRELALEYLVDKYRKTPKSISGKKLLLKGKMKIKKAALNELVGNCQASLTKKIKDADYLLLGELPGSLPLPDMPILYEQDLWEIADQAYLMEEENTATSAASILDLLLSDDADNLELALQLMDQGGMPPELAEEVIGLMLYHVDNKTRKRARLIFDRYQQLELSPEQEKLLKRQAYRVKDDKKNTLYLKALCEDNSLQLDQLAYAAYRYSNKENAQGLCLSIPGVSMKVMPDFYKYNKLYLEPRGGFAEGLYLQQFPADLEKMIPTLNQMNGLDVDNKCIIREATEYKRLKGLEKADISYHYRGKLPAEIFENTSFLELSISTNSSKIDATIGNLHQLQKLTLYLFGTKKLPETMHALQELTSLTLYLKELAKFPAFILQLKKLKRLYISSAMEQIPKEIEALKALEYLTITLEANEIPDELLQLPSIKSLDIKTSKALPLDLLKRWNDQVNPAQLKVTLSLSKGPGYLPNLKSRYPNLRLR